MRCFPTPPGGLYAVGHCSPEVDVGDELPGQGRPRHILLRINRGNIPVNQAHVFVIQKSSAHVGEVRSGIVLLKYGVVDKWTAGRPGAVSHHGIQITNNAIQCHPVYDGDGSNSLPCAVHCRSSALWTGNVARPWRWYSTIMLASNGCASWPRRVADVVEQG